MLPAIKENDSASFVVFDKKKNRKNKMWKSRELLKRKVKQIQGPKMKFPDCLVRFYEKKKLRVETSSNFCNGFPDVEKMMDKIRLLTNSPFKRCGMETESLAGKKFKF